MTATNDSNMKLNTIGAKIVFLTFRQQTHTLQGVLVVSKESDEHQVSKQMLKYATLIPVRFRHDHSFIQIVADDEE